MGKITKKSISLILVLSLLISLVWIPKPVYAANVFQSIGDFLRGVGDWTYEHTFGALDKKRAKYFAEALPVQPQANYIDSNNTYNEYVYAGGNTYYYTPITTNNNQTYRYYDIDNNIYRTTNNYEYSPTYNLYHMTYEDNDTTFNYYMQDNYTYVSYIIECPEDPNENKYFEVYYELPDGRNSYNLTVDDLKGVVFTYDVDLYETSLVDDNLWGLWHLDGNLVDSFNPNNSITSSANILNDFYDGYFDGALKLSGLDNYFTLNVDGDLTEPFTLEWIEYDYDTSFAYEDRNLFYWQGWSHVYKDAPGWDWINSYYYVAYPNRNIPYKGNVSQYYFYALTFDGESYSLFINGVKDNSFDNVLLNVSLGDQMLDQTTSPTYPVPRVSKSINVPFLDITQDSITFRPFVHNYRSMSQVSSRTEEVTQYHLNAGYPWPASWIGKTLLYYYERLNLDMARYTYLIDEVRLSSGVLYTENYNVRREPFDIGFAYTVPDNPESGKVYIQSQTDVSRFQIGGVRSSNPLEGEVFISTDGNIGEMATQYKNGRWQYVPAAVYFNGEFRDIAEFDFVNLMFISGTDASGGSYVVELPEEVTSLLEKIDQKLASILNPLKPIDDTQPIPFKDPGTDDEMQSFHLSDFFILLVYFILFCQILGDFVSTFLKLTDWVYHLWAIEGLPGPLAGNEYFMGVWTILHGGTAFGLPQPIKIFGVVTLHDFMVILFEIAFIGLMVAFYRKKLVNFKFPTLR